ncbi:protein trichome birefringence-like [Zingiber officinale]|uniref:protein trichome birefringence-like n=1 Tax=Zingiber officinale TaxID=94328 RepID=UPI001C4CDCEB|nr:protein trichome birefringence-like [Zingiber officinale]
MNESSKLAQSSAIISDLRELFSLFRSRRTKVFLYGSALAFVAFTAYLAFCPAEKGSPWFSDFFSYASTSTASYRPQISSIVSYIFPNSSSPQIPASFPEGDGGGWSRSGGVPEGSLSSAAGGEMDQNSGVLARKKDAAANSVSVAKGSCGTRARDRRSGILAKNETMPHGAAVSEGDGGGGVTDQKSGVLGENDATAAKGDAIANADGVRSQRGRVSEGNSTTAGRGAGDPKNGKNETAAEDDVVRSQRGGTSVSNLTNSGGAAKDQKSGVFLAKKNETAAAAAADGVSAEKGGISTPNNHTSSRIESQGNGVAKNTTSNGDSKTKGLGASSKTTILATRNQTATDSQSKNQITSGVLPPNASDLQSKNMTKATDGSKKDASAARKNQTAKGEASGGTKVSTSSKESTIAPQNNGSLAKNQSISSKGRNQADWISSMKSCDIFQGKWVKDNSYPLYPEGAFGSSHHV